MEQFGDPETNKNGYQIITLKDLASGTLSYGSTAAAVEYDGLTRYIRITDITAVSYTHLRASLILQNRVVLLKRRSLLLQVTINIC